MNAYHLTSERGSPRLCRTNNQLSPSDNKKSSYFWPKEQPTTRLPGG